MSGRHEIGRWRSCATSDRPDRPANRGAVSPSSGQARPGRTPAQTSGRFRNPRRRRPNCCPSAAGENHLENFLCVVNYLKMYNEVHFMNICLSRSEEEWSQDDLRRRPGKKKTGKNDDVLQEFLISIHYTMNPVLSKRKFKH